MTENNSDNNEQSRENKQAQPPPPQLIILKETDVAANSLVEVNASAALEYFESGMEDVSIGIQTNHSGLMDTVNMIKEANASQAAGFITGCRIANRIKLQWPTIRNLQSILNLGERLTVTQEAVKKDFDEDILLLVASHFVVTGIPMTLTCHPDSTKDIATTTRVNG
jgi:hypothetical protein